MTPLTLSHDYSCPVAKPGKDGKIQGSNSYGNDPNPPKDTKP